MLSANLMPYFSATHHAGKLPEATHNLEVGSKHQGRWIAMDLQVRERQITAVGYHVYGCPYTIALTEYLARQLMHQPLTLLQHWQWPAEVVADIPEHKRNILSLLQWLLNLEPAV